MSWINSFLAGPPKTITNPYLIDEEEQRDPPPMITEIEMQGELFKLQTDVAHQPPRYSIIYRNVEYQRISNLVENCLLLKDSASLYAEMSNFLLRGQSGLVIENDYIEQYKKFYKEQVLYTLGKQAKGETSNYYNIYNDCNYLRTIFNIDEIAQPRFEENKLIYYVKEIVEGTPRKVIIKSPFDPIRLETDNTFLPLLDEEFDLKEHKSLQS